MCPILDRVGITWKSLGQILKMYFGAVVVAEITTAIVNGRQPPPLNAKRLMRLTARLPPDQLEQRALLGFR